MALEVHTDDVVPIGFGQVEDHLVAQDACIVDEDVEGSEVLDSLFDDAPAERPVGDVAGDGECLSTCGLDLVDHVVGRCTHVVDDDGCTGSRESECFGATQAGAGAGDGGNFAFQAQ